MSSSFNWIPNRNKAAALIVLLLLLTTTKGFSQCTFPTTTATKVGADHTFCIDNINTITTTSVKAGQYVVVNVVKGFKYTFSVGNVFTADNETLTVFNAANGILTSGTSTSTVGASITTWTSTISGKVKVLLSKGSCVNDGTTGGVLTLTLNSIGNTQDSQVAFGTNTWVAHVYNLNAGTVIPPGGTTSPATPTEAYPFVTENYVGNYNIATESITEIFGSNTTCFNVTSAATNIYTETFAVRYRMKSTRPAGYYLFNVTGDDGVRVYVDDVLVFNQWKEQSPTAYCNNFIYLNGNSTIVIDYYENAGQNELQFSLTPFNPATNSIAGNSTLNVCSGSSPGTLIAPAYAPCSSQTISNIVYQWQVSSDNSTWTNIASTNSKDYVVPTITTTTNNIRYFRRNLQQTVGNSTQPLSSSNVIRVNTSAASILGATGTITGITSQCASLMGQVYTVPAVANALNYAWTVPAGWTITAGQGTNSITVTTGTATQNGNVGVIVSNGCTTNAIKTLAVTVVTPSVGGTIAGGKSVCSGATSGTLTLSGHVGTVVRWESSITPFSSWTPITNTNPTYTSGNLAQTTQFRAVVQNGNCAIAYSSIATITVNPNLPASVSITANTGINVCAGTLVTFTATPTNGGTNPTYQWKVKGVNAGTGGATFTTSTLANNNTVSVVMTSTTPCSTGSPAPSNVITMTVGSTAKYNNGWVLAPNINGLDAVEIASNYSTTLGNFSACSCTVNAGVTLTIAKNGYANITNNLTNNGIVIVESDGNLKQSNDLAVNTGNVTVKRNSNLKRLDYTYWASPVKGQNLKAFSPGTVNGRFYIYNESIDSFVAIDPLTNVFGGVSGLESAAKGYAIRASNYYPVPVGTAPAEMKVFEGIFTGIPNNGVITFPLKNSANGHNLVGNPYMSNLNFEQLYQNNSSIIYNTAYFWTNVNPNPAMQAGEYPKDGAVNNYAVLNGTGAVGATTSAGAIGGSAVPNQFIKVGQGFIVKAKADGNLTFNNATRTIVNTGPFFNRTAKDDIDRYWLKLTTPLGVVTTQLIGYLPAASHEFELDYDAPLLTLGSDAFYSVLENKKLMIQGKGNFGTDDIVVLGSSQYETGSYKISAGDREGIFANGQNIYLKDRQTGTVINLSEGVYTFEATAGLTENRFEIIYRPETVLGTESSKKENIIVYRDGVNFVVKSAIKTIDKIEMYDASGRLIDQVKPNSKEVIINSASYSNGVYVLKITQSGIVTTKKVMK